MAELGINLKGQDNLSKTVKECKKAVDDLKYSSTELGKASKEFEKITNAGKPLKTELRQIQALMANMNLKGLAGSEEFTRIAQRAGELRDAMDDAQQAVRAYSSDTATLDAVASGFQGLAGGITAGTAAMQLFGVENEDVAKAILKVQSAMALLNGVQAIANTLNKDSALMLKLKAISLTANSTATTANTVAETANTTANATNATATAANTTAKTAQKVATEAATAAQIKNNLAVLANPYVLAAAAITALVAGIVVWTNSMDDSTDAQIALNAAVDAFNNEIDSQMKKAAENINTYNRLKKTYDESGEKVDEFAKKLIKNKTEQKKLGVVVKTVDDVHRLFANNTQAYQKAAMARAGAMAAEAAQAAILGSTLAELSKVYAKMRSGQEVNWRDMRKIVEAAGYSKEAAEKLMKDSGFKYYGEGLAYGNVITEDPQAFSKLLNKIMDGGALKELAKMGEQFQQNFDKINEIDFKGALTSNQNALDDVEETTGKTAKNTGKTTTNTKETANEVKKILTSLEGCDAIIQEAQKKMKTLDSTTADYAKNMKEVKDAIFAARVAKLALIDQNTLSGLSQTKNIIQDIINDLPEGSTELKKWQDKLNDINEKSYNLANALTKNGGIASWKKAQTTIDEIINNLPEGSKDLEKWTALWAELNKKIGDAQQHVEDLKKGIEKGSVKSLQDQIKDLQDTLQNKNLDINSRIIISDKIEELQRQINEKTHGKLSIEAPVKSAITTKGSDDDLRQSYGNAQAQIQQINDDFEKGIIKTKKEAVAAIDDVNAQLEELGLRPIKIEFESNAQKIIGDIQDGFSNIDSIINTVDSIKSLKDALEDGADGWEIFKQSISTVESILSGIQTVMTAVNLIQEIFNTSKAAGAAISTTQAGAETAAATATQAKAAVDAETTATTVAATAANKALEASVLDLAAAQIFAAHAAIPFTGVGLATGFVAQMMAAMAAQHAASLALQAFAEGGIVKGGSAHGDSLLVRVNAGEMILAPRQQKRLFDILNGEGSVNAQTAQITWKLRGADIYGSLQNFSKIKNNVGKKIL